MSEIRKYKVHAVLENDLNLVVQAASKRDAAVKIGEAVRSGRLNVFSDSTLAIREVEPLDDKVIDIYDMPQHYPSLVCRMKDDSSESLCDRCPAAPLCGSDTKAAYAKVLAYLSYFEKISDLLYDFMLNQPDEDSGKEAEGENCETESETELMDEVADLLEELKNRLKEIDSEHEKGSADDEE